MKNFAGAFTRGLIAKSLDSDDLLPVDKAIDAARSEGARKAWEARHAAGEGGTQFHGNFDNDIGLANAAGHIQTAQDVIASAGDEKGRHAIVGRLMEAQQHIKNAKMHAGHYGASHQAVELGMIHNKISEHIEHIFANKKDTPDAEKLDFLKGDLRTTKLGVHDRRIKFGEHHEENGGGLIPHTKALKSGDVSRIHGFHGGVEIRSKREAVRGRLKSLGFGRVDQTTRDEGHQTTEHELWEHSDGRTVRVSHSKAKDTGEHTLDLKERSQNSLARSRREFANTYGGNKGLVDGGHKAGLPPAGVKVGFESEMPLLPDAPPKRRAQ
jgi:hypothetical protein